MHQHLCIAEDCSKVIWRHGIMVLIFLLPLMREPPLCMHLRETGASPCMRACVHVCVCHGYECVGVRRRKNVGISNECIVTFYLPFSSINALISRGRKTLPTSFSSDVGVEESRIERAEGEERDVRARR